LISRLWNLDSDYDTLVKWWNDWNFGIVPIECLPPLGVIVEDDEPICAGGLYIGEGTKFGFMEWIVANKNAAPRQTHKAINMCIENIIEIANERKLKLVYTVTGEEGLQKRYTKYHGFENTESNVKTFLKDLNNEYDYLEWIQDEEQWNKSQKVEA